MQWRKGYELFLEGDKHMRRNELEEALSAYKRSRDTYRMVLEANTGWNKNLINSKISACETQILKIEKKLRDSGKKLPSSVKTPDSISVPAQTSSRTPASSGDSEYKRKYFNLYIEVENLRKQLRAQAQTVKNIDALLKEKRLAEEKVSTLQRNIENLQKQLAQPETELKNIRKQLIAERMKNEKLILARSTDSSTIQALQNENKKLNSEINSINVKLNESNASRRSLDDNISVLNSKIKKLINEKSELDNKIKKYTAEIAIVKKNYADSQNEIKKLNAWIDELNKKKGINEKLSNDIVAENRTLKNQNSAHLQNIRTLENSINELSAKLKKIEQIYNTASENLTVATARNKTVEAELKNVQNLYIKQLNAEKLNKTEVESLRSANKKHTADLQTFINRNAELTAMLETKDSASAGYIKKIGILQKELEEKNRELNNVNVILKSADIANNTKKLANLTSAYTKLESENQQLQREAKKLSADNNALASELKSVKNELAILRIPQTAKVAPQTVKSDKNSPDYQKLLKDYTDLKNKYDFLPAEIESLNKPLAEVGEKEPEISSDKELANFLMKAAEDSSKAGDFISAAWYFSELKKQNAKNAFYIYGHAFYSTIASDRTQAEKIVAELDDCREKFVLSAILAMLKGDRRAASTALSRAGKLHAASKEAIALYRKELPLIIGFFDKNSSMQSNISTLKSLLQ